VPTFWNTLFHIHKCWEHTTYKDGTDRVFRNVGTSNSDARDSSKRKNTTFRTWREFEIKKIRHLKMAMKAITIIAI